ncbi:MAG: pyridoxal-phosphate dependent enzyme [Paracoccaceae bacterium]
MTYLNNPWRGRGLRVGALEVQRGVRRDPARVLALLNQCPLAAPTPLVDVPELARSLGLGRLAIKDERGRMGLGSFKSLGAAHAIARAAYAALGDAVFKPERATTALSGQVYTAATAGNHGLSIAAGARVFGARAVIFIAESVPEAFAGRLRDKGADVVRAGDDYEASLIAAKNAAEKNGWQLLSDTSWPGYTELPLDVMEGYLVTASEAAARCEANGWRPSHVFLQAGVGGLAAAVAAHLRARWGETFTIVVVEPEAAPALLESIRAGRPVVTRGPVSSMGRLDCKEPSHLALGSLAKTADVFMTVSDAFTGDAIGDLGRNGLATSPSGGAGYAGLKAALTEQLCGLGPRAEVLLFLSEGPADD